MAKKKVTLAEAKVAAQGSLPVFINLDSFAQELFNNRPDRRVSFESLVSLTAKKAAKGVWKGEVVDSKFVVSITEPRMEDLLSEAGGIIDNQPISAARADQRMKGIKSFMRALIVKYGSYVDFDSMKSVYDEALEEMDDMLLQDGDKEVYDFRPIVEKAQSAADMACDAVIASLQEHLKEVMEKGGKARLYERVIGGLSDDRRDRLNELQRHLGKFFQFIPSCRRDCRPTAQNQRVARKPAHDRRGIRDLSNADLCQEFGVEESVSANCQY